MRALKTDVILKNFWQNNQRFADLFNTVVFNGSQVLKPEELQEMDTEVSGVIETKDSMEALTRSRDVVKKTPDGTCYVVLGIENQMLTHYGMPLRTMLYDALGYLKEYKNVTGTNKRRKHNSSEEFLSGFRKTDRLHPAITIVLYYGEKQWDGPLTLKDMMMPMSEQVENIFCDYRMNLLQVIQSNNYLFSHSDIKIVFDISRMLFAGNYEAIIKKYGNKNIDAELLRTVGAITASEKLIIQMTGKEGGVDMCTAVKAWEKQCENNGMRLGIERSRKEIILRMLSKGLDALYINDMTGITKEEIDSVQEEMLNGMKQ